MRLSTRAALTGAAFALLFPGGALAATSAGQPFPSDLYTQRDTTQITHLRVDLPKPDCTTHPSDCADIAVLDTLDGFNIQPRISIPFSGPIDLSTVSSSTIFLVGEDHHVVGINQIEWEPAANTLHFESDQQLAQDETYVLVVTQSVHDAAGHPLAPLVLSHNPRDRYQNALEEALPDVMAGQGGPLGVADLSIFTTQSIDATSKRIRNQLHDGRLTFTLGTHGERTLFPLSSIAAIQLHRQNGTSAFADSFLPTPALQIYPGSVGAVAFGSYASPDYENSDEVIPLAGTRVGVPAVQSINQLGFTLFVPAGSEPSGGWPVAIFGHGFTDSKDGAPWAVASSLANAGIATIAINVVGHGGGALGTYTVTRTDGSSVTLPSGGRGIDQDGNGTIDSTEGVSAIGAQQLVGNRDGLRQTVIDLMQLVRDLKHGVDVNGDRQDDLSTSRIYYAGQSFGGIYGVQLLGLEPDIRAGVPNVAGGSIIEVARLGGVPAPRRDRADHADAVALQRGAELSVLHLVQREHAAAEPRARRRHGAWRFGDPGADRQHRVGAAGREPGGVRAVHQAAGDHPVRARRQDGAEPDDERDSPRGRPRTACDAFPQRSRPRGLRHEREPAHVPDEHHRSRRAVRDRGSAADRDVLRK